MNSQSFFTELSRLLSKVPKAPARIENSENCTYCNNIYYSSGLNLCFDVANSKDSTYVFDSYMAINCIDGDYIVECESCYDCVDAVKCFNSNYLIYSTGMRDSSYCWDCHNCSNVFGCVNLKNKSFCIFNRQFTEQEYNEKLPRFMGLPSQQVLKALQDLKLRFPLSQVHEAYNENSPYGNQIFHNKNVYLSFDASHNENSGYLYDSFYNKYCYDMTYASRYNEQSYQLAESDNMSGTNFAINCRSCQNCSYVFDCKSCKNCFGSVGLRNKQFCLLNRQLSEEDYNTAVKQLSEELVSAGWGWDSLTV